MLPHWLVGGRRMVVAVIRVLTMVCVFWSVAASAATIAPADSDRCRILVSGEILEGDFERFLRVAEAAFAGFDGESMSKDVVCLDSPGGSLSEGAKFARHFYKNGVGTVIDDAQECYSACAVIFMMGLAEGPEVRFTNRRLHVNGRLGFNRPYMAPAVDGQISTLALSVAYDAAIQHTLDLIEIANSKPPWSSAAMMESDLLQAMLAHVGNDMFMIDTVDKAGRWEIDLIGLPELGMLTEEQAFYACENALQWQSGTTKENIAYTASVAEPYPGHRRVKRLEAPPGQVVY